MMTRPVVRGFRIGAVGAALVLSVKTGFGYEAKFSATSSAAWGVAANWVDTANGEMPVLPPGLNNPADNVEFPVLKAPTALSVNTSKDSGTAPTGAGMLPIINPVVGVLTGAWYYRIAVAVETDGSGKPSRWIKVEDPDGFHGTWAVGNANAGFQLTAAAGKTGVFHQVDSHNRPIVTVTDAAATAEIENLFGGGELQVNAPGKVTIRNTSGSDEKLIIAGGEVTLAPVSDDRAKALFDKAYVHFDASDADAFTREEGADGRTYVSEWKDVRRNGMSAGRLDNASANIPFLSSDRSPTGLGFVDFGSFSPAEVGEYGPTNCVLAFPRTTKVREIFYVSKYPRAMRSGDQNGPLGDTQGYPLLTDSGLMFGGVSSACAKNGQLQYDGKRFVFCDDTYLNINLCELAQFGIACTNTIALSVLGATRFQTKDDFNKRIGNVRIGEVLIYTQELSHVERSYIGRYLTHKWLTGDEGIDYSAIDIRDGKTLGVAAGASAKVSHVRVADGKSFIKTGAGEIKMSRLSPPETPVELRGGSVSFAAAPTLAATAPADDPYLWLDANVIAESDKSVSDETTYLPTWTDCREDVGRWATSQGTEAPKIPTLKRNAVGSLSVIDFGLVSEGKQSAYSFPNWGQTVVYSAYMVFRPKITGNTMHPIFGGNSTSYIRDAYPGRLLGANIRHNRLGAALWTLNGVPVDPFQDYGTLINQTNEFLVVGFSSSVPTDFASIGKVTSYKLDSTYSGGNIEVGEVVVYKRRLTEAERLETEAYLMNRWLKKDHPCAGKQMLGKVTCAVGVPAEIGGDGDVEIPAMSVGTETFVKMGSGKTTVNVNSGDLTALDIRGGTAEIRTTPIAIAPRFRFDASAEGTVEYTVSDNGDGTSRTNVTKWLDADGNGLSARPPATFSVPGAADGGIVSTNPALVSVETRSGVVRPALDFGTYSGYSKEKQHAGTAGLNIHQANGTAISGGYSCVREAFVVWQDTMSSYSFLFSDSSTYHYHRNGNKILTDNAGTQVGPKDGYHAVDGTEVPYDYALDKQFHVVNFAPTNATAVNRIAWDRTSNAGACRICEMICFNEYLTVAQRKYLEQKLIHKWLEPDGTPEPVWTNVYASVAVAAGATLDLGADALSTPELNAAGAIKCASVVGVESLEIPCTNGIPVAATVTAPLAFAGGVIPVTLEGFDVKAFMKAGLDDVLLLQATSISGADGFAPVADLGRCTGRIYRSGNELRLKIIPPGLMLIVK